MKEQEIEISNSILFEFQRYVRGEMTKREESTFQKNIRKDLYAEAAIEGFTEVPEEETSFFTNLAEEEEEKRIRNRKRLLYSILASVIILVVATSAYLVVEKKITVKQFRPLKFLNSGTPALVKTVTDQIQIAGFQAFESMSQMAVPDIRTVPAPPPVVPDPAATPAVTTDSLEDDRNEILATAVVADTSGTVQTAPADTSAIVQAANVSDSGLRNKADTTASVTNPEGFKAPPPEQF